MKKSLVFLAAISLSTTVLAGNMGHESKSGDSMHSDMKAMHGNMKSMHSGMNEKMTQSEILKNKDMQRLHEEMTLYGLSETGMEARLDMMTEKGRAYHRALEQQQKNTAG